MSVYQSTWHHIRRSPFQSLVALLVMIMSFVAFTLFFIISDGSSTVLKYFETKPEITIFLKDGINKDTIEALQKELAAFTGVREIKYISKQEAFESYKSENKDNPMLTEMVTPSILPASFEVTVSDARILDQIAQSFSTKTDTVDEIIYQKDLINSILKWTENIRKFGVITVSLISIFAFMVIFVIIGMKITNRKDEVKVSRLLGATNFYVKRPFLLEGMFYGAVGSILGWILVVIPAIYFSTSINTFFNPITFIRLDYEFYLIIFAIELLIGITLGYVASYLGVKRYIKF